jgi:transposase
MRQGKETNNKEINTNGKGVKSSLAIDTRCQEQNVSSSISTKEDMKPMPYTEFLKRYPNDDAVLNEMFDRVYNGVNTCPECEKETKWHRIQGRKCFSCQHCGHHLFPLAQTPMKDTKLPLTHWFFAMLLFANSKNGVSAKELERQLGVTYKTAFRIGKTLRSTMVDDDVVLSGRVEMDESLFGGKKKGGKRGWGADRPCVFGMVERGGDIVTRVVPNRERKTLMPIIVNHTTEETEAFTDEFGVYNTLKNEVASHSVICHKLGQHVAGDEDQIHTQTIDGHWSKVKRSIRGTYVAVKHLQNYLNEFDFKRNHRHEVLFDVMRNRMAPMR